MFIVVTFTLVLILLDAGGVGMGRVGKVRKLKGGKSVSKVMSWVSNYNARCTSGALHPPELLLLLNLIQHKQPT